MPRNSSRSRPGSVKQNRKSLKQDFKKFPPERLAERVFIHAPRTLSFSHRPLGSLRHPYLSMVHEFVGQNYSNPRARMNAMLEAILECRNEAEKWKRVATIFDCKMDAAEMDKMRQELLMSPLIISKIEDLWTIVGGHDRGVYLQEDVYRHFHNELYQIILDGEGNIAPAVLSFIIEDFTYDCRGAAGVSFGSFGVSMLELVDNWTLSRDPQTYATFLQQVVERLKPVHEPVVPENSSFELTHDVFFSGGILAKRSAASRTEYFKTVLTS